jgi:putative membrane protein insertion efficiency factor
MPAISMRNASMPLKFVLVWGIRAYQTLVSPALPGSCKYYPSCSQYAVDALNRYGVARGFVLACWRLVRCNPLSYGGYDPVDRQRLFAPRDCSADRGRCCASSQGGHVQRRAT